MAPTEPSTRGVLVLYKVPTPNMSLSSLHVTHVVHTCLNGRGDSSGAVKDHRQRYEEGQLPHGPRRQSRWIPRPASSRVLEATPGRFRRSARHPTIINESASPPLRLLHHDSVRACGKRSNFAYSALRRLYQNGKPCTPGEGACEVFADVLESEDHQKIGAEIS